jgi:hypothetical protein
MAGYRSSKVVCELRRKTGQLSMCILLTAILVGLIPAAGCSRTTLETPDYIPPGYYASLDVHPDELLKAYFHPNFGDVVQSDQNFKNLPVVFKSVSVNEIMLRDSAQDIFYISSVKCTPLEAGAVSALRVGDLIDIIGINRGPWPEYPGWLSFTECIFPQAGAIQFSQGGPVFAPAY